MQSQCRSCVRALRTSARRHNVLCSFRVNPASEYLIIRPHSLVSRGVRISSALPDAAGSSSLDIYIARQIEAAASCLLSSNSAIQQSTEPAWSQIARIATHLRTSLDLPASLLSPLLAAYRNGTAWIGANLSEAGRAIASRTWDEIYVLGNLALDINTMLLNRRLGRTFQLSTCWVADESGSGLTAAATFEVPGQGKIATAASLPYVRNIWSGRPGRGADLIRYMRDCTGSSALLVKPLSAGLSDYYCQCHHGEPAPQFELQQHL